ncbi:O-antigen ligase family protein [Guyparkeria sp.]|uniref:O-antigen ligase family protein n=1 Tax=Guyparkeria sp. TaxID=2035736 RepID=UPI0035694537
MNLAAAFKSGKGSQLLAGVSFWYIVAVPSLLFLTNIGEKAYQDAFFLVLLVHALFRGRADWSAPVLLIWSTWLAYLGWWALTDSLGRGAIDLDPFRTGLLMLLLPWLVGWARDENFRRPLRAGFRVALGIAAAVAVIQVFVLGAPRATGSENALVFAALVSIYGLFIVYEECVRGRGRGHPIVWMVVALVPVVLSGSRTVMAALLILFLLMLFRYRRSVDFRTLIVSFVGATLFLAIFAGPQLASRVTNVVESLPTSVAEWQDFRDEFVGMDFVEPKAEETEPSDEVSGSLKQSYKTSLGFRLVYWRTGWEVFLANPVFGVGSTQDMLEVGSVLGLGSFFHDQHSHVHNTFLQHLVTGGVPKLILLLSVLIVPLFVLKSGQAGREPILFITAGLVMFGMTNIVLELTVVTFIYTLVIAYLLTAGQTRGRVAGGLSHERSDGSGDHS